MEGLIADLAFNELKPFVCVEDAEEYLRSNGVDVEKVLRDAEERAGELERGWLKTEDRGRKMESRGKG